MFYFAATTAAGIYAITLQKKTQLCHFFSHISNFSFRLFVSQWCSFSISNECLSVCRSSFRLLCMNIHRYSYMFSTCCKLEIFNECILVVCFYLQCFLVCFSSMTFDKMPEILTIQSYFVSCCSQEKYLWTCKANVCKYGKDIEIYLSF